MLHILQKLPIYLSVIMVVLLDASYRAPVQDLLFGIASGYPPYQFQNQGQTAGFDANVIRLVAEKAGLKVTFVQKNWDDVINYLRFNKVDCIVGVEINTLRQRLFDFTASYYNRTVVVFVRADNDNIQSIDNLYGRKITGDRHSFVESYWSEKGIKERIRIRPDPWVKCLSFVKSL